MQKEETIYRNVRFWFRFIDLSSASSELIQARLALFGVRSKIPEVVSFPLNETTDYSELFALLEAESAMGLNYGIWVSLVTSIDHGGVTLPPFILDIIRRTSAGVEFSFVACLGED